MNFAIYDATGRITETGIAPDGQEINMVPPGGMLFIGAAEMWDSIDVATGQLVPGTRPPPSYKEQRRMAYPTIASQLDMLWHAMKLGDLPMAHDWFNIIAEVKDRIPKPDGESITTVEA